MTALESEDFPVGIDADVLRELSADDLADLAACEGTDYAPFAKTEIRRRRDAARGRVRRQLDPVAMEWREAAHAQYIDAEAACEGNLVKPGTRAGFDPWSLWSGPMWSAERYASWELLRYWEQHPRVTVSEYRERLRHALEEEESDNGGLADDDTGCVRHGSEAGAGGDVCGAGPVRDTGHVRGPGRDVTDADRGAAALELREWQEADTLASYADVMPLEQEHLWDGYIPFGKVTLIAGDSGIGKGFMLSDLAARVSRGDVMPDGSAGGPPGHVIMITPEDDPRTCTIHRLRAHGADLAMVHDLTIVNGNVWCIQEDINELRRLITACGGAALVIIDPISAVTLVGLTSDVPVRRKVLGPLEAVARETGCAIVVVGHLTKTGAAAAQKNRAAAKDGMGGTKGLSNAARIMLTVVRDDADPRIRTLSVVKSNGSDDKAAPAMRYTISGTPPRVEWLGDAAEGPAAAQSQEAAVLEAARKLGPGQHHGRRIAVRANVPYDSARMALSRLAAKGEMRHAGAVRSGLYELGSEVDALEAEVTRLTQRAELRKVASRDPASGLPLPRAWAELSRNPSGVPTQEVRSGQEARR